MSLMVTTLRRSLWLLLIGAAGGAALAWWRDRNTPTAPSAPPEWPPLKAAPAPDPAPTTAPAPTPTSEPTATPAPSSSGTASIVNALVDAPEARSTADAGGWVLPNDDGTCPESHPIKANDNSSIFHVPGGRFYDRTRAERCYATADAAIADGYRQAKA